MSGENCADVRAVQELFEYIFSSKATKLNLKLTNNIPLGTIKNLITSKYLFKKQKCFN